MDGDERPGRCRDAEAPQRDAAACRRRYSRNREWLREEQGAALVFVVLCLPVFFAAAAIAVDIGLILDTRMEAQRAADAAALAGASAFLPPPVPYAEQPDSARARARDFVRRNLVGGAIVPVEDVEVTVRMDSLKVHVTLRRRGLRTWFASILGYDFIQVSAEATAWSATSGRAGCLKPFIIVDAWDDRDRNGKWSPGDHYDPATTGWGSSFRNKDGSGYFNDIGRPVVLKRGQTGVAHETGWYQLIRIANNRGGNDIRLDIRDTVCNPTILDVDEFVPGEWGATVGPVLQGVEDLINLDPDARWQNGRIVGSKFGHNGDGSTSPRIINVPLMNPSQVVVNNQKEFLVTNFAAVFLESVDRTGNESSRAVYGRWLTLRGIPDNCFERGTCRPSLRYLRLIE